MSGGHLRRELRWVARRRVTPGRREDPPCALVVGASGFIGTALQSVSASEAVGTYCNHPVEGLRHLDMRDTAVERLLAELSAQLIIQPADQPHVTGARITRRSPMKSTSPAPQVAAAARAGRRVTFFRRICIQRRQGPYRRCNPHHQRLRPHKLEADRYIADTLDTSAWECVGV